MPESSRRTSLFWNLVALVCGWTIFGYWWFVVLNRTTRQTFESVLTGVGFVVAMIFIVSVFWIAHNLRLAERGFRERATRYRPATDYERDKLDRAIVLGDLHELRDSSIVVVTADGGEKRFDAQPDSGQVA